MGDRLELRVLGAVELRRDGEPVPIGGPKPRLTLALLAAQRGTVVSTDRLCDALWGDDAPADPPAVLQSVISRLRRLLRPEADIVGRPPGYALEAGADVIDADRFEALAARARTVPNAANKAELLRAALDCWQGRALEEFADHEWARPEAVRLDELRLAVREDLLEARLALGEHHALVGELEALVAEAPLRERPRHDLILALYRSGRSAEAVREASDFRRQMRDELGLEPSPLIRDLEARVLNDDPTLLPGPEAPARSSSRRLPVPTTRLIGRDADVSGLVDLLATARLVTLTGPGGVGKTRIALALAHDRWDDHRGEVYLVELAPVHDGASTVAAIATAVDVQQRQHLSVEATLIEYLRTRRAMLVLDNCEHLRSTVAPLVDRLLVQCPDIAIVVTSREVLGLPSEHVWRVQPLATAPEGASSASVADAPAVQLLIDRAAAARATFALHDGNADAIGEIARRLDGLPLALELAAARMGAMGPAALAQRLDRRFDVLAGAQPAMIPRHRALQDLVSWSHELLEPEEQALFARLSVFAGSFGLDAAERVCAGAGLGPGRVPVLVANLVDKSMVQLVDADRSRYRLLETLREYGRGRVAAADREGLRDAHARWFLDLAERCADDLDGPREAAAVEALDLDFDNLRSAHVWSVERGDVDLALRLVAGLREYAFRGLHAEVLGWADAALRIPGVEADPGYPLVLAMTAQARFVRGDLEAAIEIGERAIAVAGELGVDCSGLAERALANAWFYRGDIARGTGWMDRMIELAPDDAPARLSHALYMRSVSCTSLGDTVRGEQLAVESGRAAARSGSPTARAQAQYAHGLALETTSPDEAAELLQGAADVARRAGNRWVEAFALTEVLWLEARRGDPRCALGGYADVVDVWYRGGDWANQWLSLRHVFGILAQLRAHLGAATIHGALMAAGAAYALPFQVADADHLEALVDDLREHLGPSAFAGAVRRGAAFSDGELIDFVRSQINAASSAPRSVPTTA